VLNINNNNNNNNNNNVIPSANNTQVTFAFVLPYMRPWLASGVIIKLRGLGQPGT
jgi:hypothetical protein